MTTTDDEVIHPERYIAHARLCLEKARESLRIAYELTGDVETMLQLAETSTAVNHGLDHVALALLASLDTPWP